MLGVVNDSIYVKNNRNQIKKYVRERYLRNDVSCHSVKCLNNQCKKEDASMLSNETSFNDNINYLLFDKDYLIDFIELIDESLWCDVIIPISIFNIFAQEASSNSYNTLCRLLSDSMRRFILFDDRHCFDIQNKINRQLNNTTQLLLYCADWYIEHLNYQVNIIIISDHNNIVSDGSSDYKKILSLKEFLNLNVNADETLHNLYRNLLENNEDKKNDNDDNKENHNRLYAKYLSNNAIESGLEQQIYYTGYLRVDRYQSSEAFVDLGNKVIEKEYSKIFIPNNEFRNRAIDGDEVVVKLLPINKWCKPGNTLISSLAAINPNSNQDDNSTNTNQPHATGCIVGIVNRHWRSYVATIQENDINITSGWILCIPMDSRIPKIRINCHQINELASSRIIVKLKEWKEDSKYPNGYYVKKLGEINDLETEMQAILIENEIAIPSFSNNLIIDLPSRNSNANANANNLNHNNHNNNNNDNNNNHNDNNNNHNDNHNNNNNNNNNNVIYAVGYNIKDEKLYETIGNNPYNWDIPSNLLQDRLDLREELINCVCSIDPPGCTDIDDALSVRKLSNGHYELGVHIADVTSFFDHNSKLDLIARSLGTTVYLVDRRINMLPEILSEDLCSLRGNTDRLCVSVLWEIEYNETNNNIKFINTWMGRTIIHNQFAFSYEDAQLLANQRNYKHLSDNILNELSDSLYLTNNIIPKTKQSRRLLENKLLLYCSKLKILLNVGRFLKKQRFKNGALQLDSNEINFKLNNNKQPIDIDEGDHVEMHETIAEFMIHANRCVAEKIYKIFPNKTLLRHHLEPPNITMKPLYNYIQTIKNFKKLDFLSINNNTTLSDILNLFESYNDNKLLEIIRLISTRCLSEAHYISSGKYESSLSYYHYGLAVPFYTHFTSPIRRYADIIVHRMLIIALKLGTFQSKSIPPGLIQIPFNNNSLSEVCDRLNIKNRAAKIASRMSNDLFMYHYIQQQKNQHIRSNATIYEVTENGIKAYVKDLNIKVAILLIDIESSLLCYSKYDHGYIKNQLIQNNEFVCKTKFHNTEKSIHVDIQEPIFYQYKFTVLDDIIIDIYIEHESRYRIVKPIGRVVFSKYMEKTYKIMENNISQINNNDKNKNTNNISQINNNDINKNTNNISEINNNDVNKKMFEKARKVQISKKKKSKTLYNFFNNWNFDSIKLIDTKNNKQSKDTRIQIVGRISFNL